ncbi:unannotated protein [freshwater metagenome]|uniref:Unannotated protein n=1 Tax=freshwater metagenome TaxID=449393 RepID=A0A6J6YJL8_9ZZZZ
MKHDCIEHVRDQKNEQVSKEPPERRAAPGRSEHQPCEGPEKQQIHEWVGHQQQLLAQASCLCKPTRRHHHCLPSKQCQPSDNSYTIESVLRAVVRVSSSYQHRQSDKKHGVAQQVDQIDNRTRRGQPKDFEGNPGNICDQIARSRKGNEPPDQHCLTCGPAGGPHAHRCGSEGEQQERQVSRVEDPNPCRTKEHLAGCDDNRKSSDQTEYEVRRP